MSTPTRSSKTEDFDMNSPSHRVNNTNHADDDPAFIPVIAVHGGASASSASVHEYRHILNRVLLHGQSLLQQGKGCVDVAAEVCRMLEEVPFFNAGHGSVFNCEGEHELDASCMRGSDLASGSVAGARICRNPVLVAKRLLEKGNTVLLAGRGADIYAQNHGCCEIVPNTFFDTTERKAQYESTQHLTIAVAVEDKEKEEEERQQQRAQQQHQQQSADGSVVRNSRVGAPQIAANDVRNSSRNSSALPSPIPKQPQQQQQQQQRPGYSTGTVGAVVLDTNGNIAAATSSGGLTNKPVGRIADTGVIGAGTYASDAFAGVSCAGSGECLIRCSTAYSVVARMRFGREPFFTACDQAIFEDLAGLGGVGGLIAVDPSGNVAMPFSSTGFPRGFVQVQGPPRIAVVREPLRTLEELMDMESRRRDHE